MKKMLLVLVFVFLTSCQFFYPTASLDKEPIEVQLNDSLFLIQDFDYSLIKKVNSEQSDLVLCDSIDSLFIGNQIIIFRQNNYFKIENSQLIKTQKNNIQKFVSTEHLFKHK